MPQAPPAADRDRHGWIDAARGLAAVIVFVQHLLLQVQPDVAAPFTQRIYNPALTALALFFLVSGYIIPETLEHTPSLGRFWFNRLLRLYPLYWVTLIAVFALNSAGLFVSEPGFDAHNWKHVWGNILALQRPLGVPHASYVYWTLAPTLFFYVLSSAMVFTKDKKTPSYLLLTVCFGLVFIGCVPAGFLGYRLPFGPSFVMLAFALLGHVLRQFTRGEISKRRTCVMLGTFIATLAGVAWVTSSYPLKGGQMYPAAGAVTFCSWIIGLGLFALFYACRAIRFARPVTFIGLISYSVYLVHPFVVASLPRGTVVWIALCVAIPGTIVLATLGSYVVELPAIRVAKRLTSRKVANQSTASVAALLPHDKL